MSLRCRCGGRREVPSRTERILVNLVGSSRATEKIVWGLSLKIIQNDTIDIEDLIGVQNRQSPRSSVPGVGDVRP